MPENTEDSALFRQQLRQTLLAARSALSAAQREHHSCTIMAHLRHWLRESTEPCITTKTIGFCLPFRGECDVVSLMTELADSGWSVSVPVATQPARAMIFHCWSPAAPIAHDRHGVPFPATEPCAAPALLLLPVVGVDARGYRLGYGGGYFDRTVAALAHTGQRPLCLGVGFALAQIDDLVPEQHDQALDFLVTEAGITDFTARGFPQA